MDELNDERYVSGPKRANDLAEANAKRNQGYNERKKKLGFKVADDKADDPVLEKYEFDDRVYQKALTESRARPPVKFATKIQGVGRGEYGSNSLNAGEGFVKH